MARACLVLGALILFVACGANDPAASPAPLKPASNSTRVVTPADTPIVSQDGGDAQPTLAANTQDARQENIDCGDLSISGKPPRAYDAASAQVAAACFMSALNICQPAVLTIRERETGVLRQFSITGTRPNCLVRQALQPDANAAPAVVDCEHAKLQNEKLEINGCSHLGDFILSLGN